MGRKCKYAVMVCWDDNDNKYDRDEDEKSNNNNNNFFTKKRRRETEEQICSKYECMFISKDISDCRAYFYQLTSTSNSYKSLGILKIYKEVNGKLYEFPKYDYYDYSEFELWATKKE